MTTQIAKEMRNYANYIERKLKEEINELEKFMQEKYKDLEIYKNCCIENSHEDDEVQNRIEEALDDEGSTEETADIEEAIGREYCDEIYADISPIITFEDAAASSYLMRDSDYEIFIQEGQELEKLIIKLKLLVETLP